MHQNAGVAVGGVFLAAVGRSRARRRAMEQFPTAAGEELTGLK